MIARANNDLKQAVLYFEEVINLNLSESTTLKALHEIMLIRVEERDIYQAYYTLDRLEDLLKGPGFLVKAKQFLEGAVSMMKKKYREGLGFLDELVDDQDLHDQLKPLVLSYRAYGNFHEGNIELAAKDYKALKDKGASMESDEYNLELCLGVLHAIKKEWDVSAKRFESARRISPAKIEPRFYQAVG